MDSNLETFLNSLADAERAGGRVLHELEPLAKSSVLKELLRKVEHDEGYWAGGLAAQIRRLGGNPSNRTGDFVDKVRAIAGLREKLELLNRGQRWVIRKIDENLASVADDDLKGFLTIMSRAHQMNIEALDSELKQGNI